MSGWGYAAMAAATVISGYLASKGARSQEQQQQMMLDPLIRDELQDVLKQTGMFDEAYTGNFIAQYSDLHNQALLEGEAFASGQAGEGVRAIAMETLGDLQELVGPGAFDPNVNTALGAELDLIEQKRNDAFAQGRPLLEGNIERGGGTGNLRSELLRAEFARANANLAQEANVGAIRRVQDLQVGAPGRAREAFNLGLQPTASRLGFAEIRRQGNQLAIDEERAQFDFPRAQLERKGNFLRQFIPGTTGSRTSSPGIAPNAAFLQGALGGGSLALQTYQAFNPPSTQQRQPTNTQGFTSGFGSSSGL